MLLLVSFSSSIKMYGLNEELLHNVTGPFTMDNIYNDNFNDQMHVGYYLSPFFMAVYEVGHFSFCSL